MGIHYKNKLGKYGNISQMLHGAGIFTNIYPKNHPVL
jgi:hypothetical protein